VLALLKRMASSQRLALKIRAGDLTMVDFIPMQETRAALEQFISDRGLATIDSSSMYRCKLLRLRPCSKPDYVQSSI
jgi:hypothetical protein